MIKKGRFSKKNSATAGVFMAATMEYLTATVLEKAGEAAKSRKSGVIKPKDLKFAVNNHEDLC